jgi:hypothetical protein
MELRAGETARYFVASTMCLYIATICLILIIVSAFFSAMRDASALTATGVFGLLVSAAVGCAFYWSQLRELRYEEIETARESAPDNYRRARSAALRLGWTILDERQNRRLDAQTPQSRFSAGERVQISFQGKWVWVASICDPAVGFSLVGRQKCVEHRAAIRAAVLDTVEPA